MSTPPSSSSSLGLACYNACRRQCSFFFLPQCIWAQNSTTTLRADPQATVYVRVTVRAVREHSSCAASCNNGNPTEDQRHGYKEPAEFSRKFALCDFLDRPAAEKATCAMLSDMISECKSTLSRPLSLCIHYAAVEAQTKKGLECLLLKALVLVKTTYLCDGEGALAAPPFTESKTETEAVNVSCLQEFGEERQLGTLCPVCLDDFTFSARDCLHFTTCGHVFHDLCFLRWLQRSNKAHCPVCRFNFGGFYKRLI